MTARPDLDAIKAEAEEFSFDSSPAGRMSGLLEEVIVYALTLEQDAAGLRVGLELVRDGYPKLWRDYCLDHAIPGWRDRHDDPPTWWLKAMAAHVLGAAS